MQKRGHESSFRLCWIVFFFFFSIQHFTRTWKTAHLSHWQDSTATSHTPWWVIPRSEKRNFAAFFQQKTCRFFRKKDQWLDYCYEFVLKLAKTNWSKRIQREFAKKEAKFGLGMLKNPCTNCLFNPIRNYVFQIVSHFFMRGQQPGSQYSLTNSSQWKCLEKESFGMLVS